MVVLVNRGWLSPYLRWLLSGRGCGSLLTPSHESLLAPVCNICLPVLFQVMGQPRKALNFFIIAAHMGKGKQVGQT
jgi:hypothetical protein